jgi:para-nitrobenzyl esterase
VATFLRHLTRWTCLLALVPAATAAAPASAGTAAPASAGAAEAGGHGRSVTVHTDHGVVRGKVVGGVRQFLGIPYAAPPVAGLRWRPPQPAPAWHGIRDATAFAPHCAQSASPFGVASASEDCLYLNIFTPSPARRGAPVMVWIHGGGLVTGESEDYDPAPLVARGVIVVTLNYRLGALGFLAHPALTAESAHHASGNFGLLDQQAALRWVQRNARSFGGNPSNVTIFGESAGGLSVHSQLASPLAAGLFHRAIVQSGGYLLTAPPLSAAEAAGAAFASQAGCADQSAACLRTLPVQTILARQGEANTTVDGYLLPLSPVDAFASSAFNRVPVIEGTNHDEWRLFVAQTEAASGVPLSAAAYVLAIAATLRIPVAAATALAAAYPVSAYPSPSLALGALGTDAIFACNARRAAGLLSQHVPTYQYEFNDPNAPQRFFPSLSFPTGAYHAAELQYLFSLTRGEQPVFTPEQVRLSQTMVWYWTRFAWAGNPNSPRTPSWPRYDTTEQRFQALVPGTSRTATGFATDHKCALFGG